MSLPEDAQGDRNTIQTADLSTALTPSPPESPKNLWKALTGVFPEDGQGDRNTMQSADLGVALTPRRLPKTPKNLWKALTGVVQNRERKPSWWTADLEAEEDRALGEARVPRTNSTLILSRHQALEDNNSASAVERPALGPRAQTWGAPRRRAKAGSINHSAAHAHARAADALPAEPERHDSPELSTPVSDPGPALLYFDPAITVAHEHPNRGGSHSAPRSSVIDRAPAANTSRQSSIQSCWAHGNAPSDGRSNAPSRSRPPGMTAETAGCELSEEELQALVLDESAPLLERYRAMSSLSGRYHLY